MLGLTEKELRTELELELDLKELFNIMAERGYNPRGFKQSLMNAIARAIDANNKAVQRQLREAGIVI